MRRRCVNSTQMVGGCLRFSLFNLPPRTTFAICALGANTDLEYGDDSVDYVIHFRPPLSRKSAHDTKVGVTYCGDKEQTAPSCHVFYDCVLPATEGVKYSLREGDLDYELFETHQLRTYNHGDAIGSMYVTFENNYVERDRDLRVCIQVKVDMSLIFLPRYVQGAFLRWFPPDVDPDAHRLKVDPRLIPQRTPPWFKLRGISGTKVRRPFFFEPMDWFCPFRGVVLFFSQPLPSKAYTLLGFWVPRPGSKEALTYQFDQPGTFSDFARAAMRLGTITEEFILMAYLMQYPRRQYEEMGWCPAPREHYPDRWGASPDGLFIDPDVTSWSQVKYPQALGEARHMDLTRGVCEFKTSRTKTSMEAYFIPQLYMEMIALNVTWADLVRYRYARTFNPEKNGWEYKDVAHVYRYYRDAAEEKELVELWKYALDRRDRLVEVVMEPRFLAMRQKLERRALNMKPVKVIHIEGETARLFGEYIAHHGRLTRVAESVPEDDSMWSDLNERHQKLLRLDETKDVVEMVALLAEQVETCGALMSHLIRPH